MNGDNKNVINSRPYEWNEQNTLSELYTRLTTNELKENKSHSKYQNDNNDGMNSKTIESPTEYINICKNQNMVRTFQNSDIAITNSRKSIEYVKQQSENGKNKIVDTELLTDNKSQSCSITVSIKYKTFVISLSQIEYR